MQTSLLDVLRRSQVRQKDFYYNNLNNFPCVSTVFLCRDGLFHKGQQDDPAQRQQGEQRRQHIHLPTDVTPLRLHETAAGKRVGRHEHKAVVHIAHNALAVKIPAPHQVTYRRYQQHDTQHAAHLHTSTHFHSFLISLLHIMKFFLSLVIHCYIHHFLIILFHFYLNLFLIYFYDFISSNVLFQSYFKNFIKSSSSWLINFSYLRKFFFVIKYSSFHQI